VLIFQKMVFIMLSNSPLNLCLIYLQFTFQLWLKENNSESSNPKKAKNDISVGVVGSGSFATAIVKMLVENCKVVHWCVRSEFVKGAIELRGHNPLILRQLILTLKV
jgi:glycerol-3-phosphate dehydrogenase (NAD(P)+)